MAGAVGGRSACASQPLLTMARKPKAAAPPSPLVNFTTEDGLRRRAQRLGIGQLRLERDGDGLACKICYDAFGTMGDAAELVVLNTGIVLHAACAKRACEEQRLRELDTRGRHAQGDPRHEPKGAFYCEMTRVALLPREVSALQLTAWPADDEGWAPEGGDESDEGYASGGDEEGAFELEIGGGNVIGLEARFNAGGFGINDMASWHAGIHRGPIESVEEYSLLTLAVLYDRVHVVNWFLEHGAIADYETTRDYGCGPEYFHLSFLASMRSVETKSTAVLERLIAAGMRVDQVEETAGQSAISWAFASDVKEDVDTCVHSDGEEQALLNTLRVLLDAGGGTAINRETVGRTSMAIAITEYSPRTVRFMLDAGADPDGTCVYRTPLVEATCGVQSDTPANPEVISLLLERGADPNRVVGKPDHGSTVLGYALHNGLRAAKAVAPLLSDPRTDVNKGMPIAQLLTEEVSSAMHDNEVKEATESTLRLLLHDPRLNINLRGVAGKTALMLAVQCAPWAVPMLLRHKEINVTLADDQGRTALDHLVEKQASETPLPGDLFEEIERQLAAAAAPGSV